MSEADPFVTACVKGVKAGGTFMQVAFRMRTTADRVRRAVLDYEARTGTELPRSQNRIVSPERREHMRVSERRFEDSYASLPRCGRCHLRGHEAAACDLGSIDSTGQRGWDAWTW